MAAVRAKPEKESTNTDKVFAIPLTEALNALVAARHLTPPAGQTDQWFFQIDSEKLRITRSRQTVTLTPDEID
jgi:hypothetical protein